MKKLLLWIWFWLSGKRRHALSGKLIVFEGIDGSGKETQFKRFLRLLKKLRVPYKTFDFPQYDTTLAGRALKMALHGELDCDPADFPIKGLSIFFSIDRGTVAAQIKEALRLGYLVALNRYGTSNKGCQAWKYEDPQKTQEYLEWIDKVEYELFGLPKEDYVLFYNISIKNAVMLINSRERVNDKVETDIDYLTNSLEMYRQLARDNDHWITIECEDENSNLLSIEEIHERTIKAIKAIKK